MAEMTIPVQKRERIGKGGNREARRNGLIPGVVYGGGKDSVPIQLERKTFVDLMKKVEGEHPIFRLQLAGSGQERYAILREMQRDPVSRHVIHLDFQRIEMTQKVRVSVPVELIGTAFGVKTEGGVLDFVTRELAIECTATDMPGHLELDVADLRVGQHVEARELTLPRGVTLADEPDKVIVSIHGRTTAEAGEEEGGEREEPELVRRRKAEE